MKTSKSIDISTIPELKKTIEEMREEGAPRVLRDDVKALALIIPLPEEMPRRGKRHMTEEEYLRFLSSAGSWRNRVDTEQFLKDVYESRQSSRPAVEL